VMDEHQPQVPVPAAAFISYTEAVSMHPTSDPAIGHKSTDLPIPDAAKVLFVDELLEAGPTGVDESESFASVLARRRSIREYGPLSARGLVRVLDQVFKLQGFAHADDGAIRRFRPIPSAGARHPVVPLVLIGDVAGLESGLWRLDTDGRRLLLVETDPTALNAAWTKVLDAGQFGERPPAVVVLGARFDATLARYPSGAALVWRDGGVALGALHLTATAAGLGSCILGTAGVLDERLLAASGLVGSLVGDIGSLAVGGPPVRRTNADS
jgi:SagB-type dehydrogenase family enzyme